MGKTDQDSPNWKRDGPSGRVVEIQQIGESVEAGKEEGKRKDASSDSWKSPFRLLCCFMVNSRGALGQYHCWMETCEKIRMSGDMEELTLSDGTRLGRSCRKVEPGLLQRKKENDLIWNRGWY